MVDIIEAHIVDEVSRLRTENDTLKTWVRHGNGAPRCVVCGKPIKNISTQRMLRPFRWDSRECFHFKPRKIIALENEYGLDIVSILQETTRRYGKIKAQCEALGVSVPYLYSIIRKYCGDYLAFMARYTTGKRRLDYARKFQESSKNT